MVNWQAPETLLLDSLALVKIVHFVDGVYLWDWLLGLPYEYRLITQRQWRWPTLIYFGCRVSALTVALVTLIGSNTTSELDCNVTARMSDIAASATIGLSSTLIALRTAAIWHQHKVIMVIAVMMLGTNVAFLIRGITPNLSIPWNSIEQVCSYNFDIAVEGPTIWVSFATDLSLIVIMLVGLQKHKGSGKLWKLVFHQGVIWCIVALVCYLPSAVMDTLNLNAPLSLSVQTPMCLFMAICTTSMQRHLGESQPAPVLPAPLPHPTPLSSGSSGYQAQYAIAFPKPAVTATI